MKDVQKYFGEFIGTMILVFSGCTVASLMMAIDNFGATAAIALSFGLALCAMYYTIGKFSGCHINPAVSIAMLFTRKISINEFFGYITAQVAGAFAASGIMLGIYAKTTQITDYKSIIGLGQNKFGDSTPLGLSSTGALIIECILTFIFVLTFLGATSSKKTKPFGGLIIGGALTLVHLIGIPFTGTSVNPARSLAPAVLMGGESLKQVWVFIVGPLTGALLAAVVWLVFSIKPLPKFSEMDFEDDDEASDENSENDEQIDTFPDASEDSSI